MSTPTTTQVNITTQKVSVEAEYKALADSMSSDLADVSSILMAKTPYTKDDLIALFRSRVTAAEATKTARTALHAAVASERATDAKVAPLRAQMRMFLSLRFGKDSPELQKFGFTQAKVTKKSASSKAAGVVKAKATRAARGTTGKKQKAKIKAPPMNVATVATPVAATPAVVSPATAAGSPAAVPQAPAARPAVS
jgi:hypothetical protein